MVAPSGVCVQGMAGMVLFAGKTVIHAVRLNRQTDKQRDRQTRANAFIPSFVGGKNTDVVRLGLVRCLRRRRAYRQSYAATLRLTATDVGLIPRLAYDHVMHTGPAASLDRT